VTYIEYETSDDVATITLDRRDRENALDLDTYRELCEALRTAGDDDDAQAVVVRSAADDFCVGEDYEYLAGLAERGQLNVWRRGYKGFIPVTWHLPKLVIAEVTGKALGIGCELALLSDVTYASPDALFGHPEVAVGVAAPTVWPWLTGPKIAKEYLASGRLIPAPEAARVRLINRVVETDALHEEVMLLAKDFASMPPGTPAANKRVLNWAFRDVSRVLLDDLEYVTEFQWIVNNRDMDASFYESVRSLGFTEALKRRNEGFAKS
jgi:enoyl-CoA hydratase/carnithine racemase